MHKNKTVLEKLKIKKLQRDLKKIRGGKFHNFTIFLPDYCIVVALSVDIHPEPYTGGSDMANWPYDHMTKKQYGSKNTEDGCLLKEQYKCSNLAKNV